MKTFLILVLLFISTFSYTQIKYEVKDFSNDYYGVAYVTDTSDYFFKGWILIYDKESKEELIKIESDVIHFDSRDEKMPVGAYDTSFSDEYLIYYDDFNFDGVKDFAIADSHNGSYGMPTYKIYLAKGYRFIYNEKFTELGSNYLGMFYIEPGKKIIHAQNKSGCCYHENSEFIVENNAPKLILKITEDATKDDKYVYITTEKYVDGKWTKTERKEKIEDYYKE